jgi:hypothetical protein
MPALHLVATEAAIAWVDAAVPQGSGLTTKSCQSGGLWAIVHTGRTQAVCTSRRGPACCEALQENRSRGCRAPKSPFCRCAWLPSLLRATRAALRMKSFTWKSPLFRSNRPTPASTSNPIGRAKGAVMPRPALFLSAGQSGLAPLSDFDDLMQGPPPKRTVQPLHPARHALSPILFIDQEAIDHPRVGRGPLITADRARRAMRQVALSLLCAQRQEVCTC